MAEDDDTELARHVALLSERVNEDPHLVWRGRFVTLDFRLEIGMLSPIVAIAQGRVAAIDPGPHLMRAVRFSIRCRADAWRKFWRHVPPPHHHDIFALKKAGALAFDGDIQPLMANLLYFKDVLAAPRARAG